MSYKRIFFVNFKVNYFSSVSNFIHSFTEVDQKIPQVSIRYGHKWVSSWKPIPHLLVFTGTLITLGLILKHFKKSFNLFAGQVTPSLSNPKYLEQIKQEVVNHFETLIRNDKDYSIMNIIADYEGKHIPVFELKGFPGFALKLTSKTNADEMFTCVETCQKIANDNKLDKCFVPPSEVVALGKYNNETKDEYALLVMEKGKGTISLISQEKAECAYDEFSTHTLLRETWKEYFRQAAEFIALTGYHNTSWRSILLMNDGFGYVDFEKVTNTDSNRKKGFMGLLRMAPVEFFVMISETAKKYKIEITDKKLTDLKTEKTKNRLIRSKTRAWHKQISLSDPKKNISLPPTYGENSKEKEIVDHLNAKRAKLNVRYPHWPLIEQRKVMWHPFLKNADASDETRAKFETALNNLQKDKLVCDWLVDEIPSIKNWVEYTIYF